MWYLGGSSVARKIEPNLTAKNPTDSTYVTYYVRYYVRTLLVEQLLRTMYVENRRNPSRLSINDNKQRRRTEPLASYLDLLLPLCSSIVVQ
jgi:hypothetical protein